MLSARPANVNIQDDLIKPDSKKSAKLKLATKSKTSLASKTGGVGLKVSNANSVPLGVKPKPLQLSTNTIHTQKQRLSNLQKSDKQKKNALDSELKKKKSQALPTESEPTTTKVDENDVGSFITNSYNPLLDVCSFDEELYQKVLKLQLDDDGLPPIPSEEPFDF